MKYILITLFTAILLGDCNDDKIANTTYEDSLKIICTKLLKENLKDPESYINKSWLFKSYTHNQYDEAKQKYPDHFGRFYPTLIIHKYRANNDFGANILGDAYFIIDTTGTITFYSSFEKLPYYMRIFR